MIVSYWEPDQLAPGITTAVRIWARFIAACQLRTGATETAS
jgi:hypothetical protein